MCAPAVACMRMEYIDNKPETPIMVRSTQFIASSNGSRPFFRYFPLHRVKVWLCENYNRDFFFIFLFLFLRILYSWVFGLSLTVSVFSCRCWAFYSFVHFVRVSTCFPSGLILLNHLLSFWFLYVWKVCQYSVWNIVRCICVYVKKINTQINMIIVNGPHSHTAFIVGLRIPLRNVCARSPARMFHCKSPYGHFGVSFIFIHWMGIQSCFASLQIHLIWMTKLQRFFAQNPNFHFSGTKCLSPIVHRFIGTSHVYCCQWVNQIVNWIVQTL